MCPCEQVLANNMPLQVERFTDSDKERKTQVLEYRT